MYAITKNASQSVDNTQDLIEYLKQAPAVQIQTFINDALWALPPLLYFAPTIER